MKIRATFETETFISQGGYFAIQQTDGMGQESVICLAPDQMRLLIIDMQKAIADAADWWSWSDAAGDE